MPCSFLCLVGDKNARRKTTQGDALKCKVQNAKLELPPPIRGPPPSMMEA